MTPRAPAAAEPRRLTPTERLHEVTMASLARTSRVPVFGITEERAPGGIVVPLYRVEIPVCEEFPNALKAHLAVLDYYAAFRRVHPLPVNGASEGTGATETPSEPATRTRSRAKP